MVMFLWIPPREPDEREEECWHCKVEARISALIEKRLPLGFTSRDIQSMYENAYGEPIGISTVSTYLNCLAQKDMLHKSESSDLPIFKEGMVRFQGRKKTTFIRDFDLEWRVKECLGLFTSVKDFWESCDEHKLEWHGHTIRTLVKGQLEAKKITRSHLKQLGILDLVEDEK